MLSAHVACQIRQRKMPEYEDTGFSRDTGFFKERRAHLIVIYTDMKEFLRSWAGIEETSFQTDQPMETIIECYA
jgi:hypothetical protein